MKPFLILFTLLFQANNLLSQITLQWQKTIGGTSYDNIYSSVNTPDGNYVLAGVTLSNQSGDIGTSHGSADGWMLKMDNNGGILWQKLLGGTNPEFIYSINVTSDYGFIVTGKSASNDGDLSNNNGDYDVWVARLDSTGNILWSKNYGGSGEDQGAGVVQTPDGGFLIAAYSNSSDGDLPDSTMYEDWWIIKLSANGQIDWSKTLGGSSSETVHDLCATRDKGFVIAGMTHSHDGDIINHHGNDDYWIVKLDSVGDIVWQKTLGGASGEEAWAIKQVNDGGFIVTGYSGSINSGDVTGGHGAADAWVVKLNESGDIEWQKTFGGTEGDRLLAVTQTEEGGFLLAGNTLSNDADVSGNTLTEALWVIKLNPTGKILYQNFFGGSDTDWANSILKSSNGKYLISGYTRSNDGDIPLNHGWLDAYILQITDGLVPTFEAINTSLPLHPTPAHQSITIDWLEQSVDLQYSIFDSNGRAVQQGRFTTGAPLNVANLKPGIFYIRVMDDGGKAAGNKFIKH